jgi:predicted transcriptional regulator
MKEREYKLLEAISQDETVTQAGLASGLGIAVGSVNWYIKRLINRGYLKATRMDRTRLKYNLTHEGMSVLTQRATQYMKDSLQIYKNLREAAKMVVSELENKGISHVYLDGEEDVMDIMRLTCIEGGIQLDKSPGGWVIKHNGRKYKIKEVVPSV